jgi:hypothetical protein
MKKGNIQEITEQHIKHRNTFDIAFDNGTIFEISIERLTRLPTNIEGDLTTGVFGRNLIMLIQENKEKLTKL